MTMPNLAFSDILRCTKKVGTEQDSANALICSLLASHFTCLPFPYSSFATALTSRYCALPRLHSSCFVCLCIPRVGDFTSSPVQPCAGSSALTQAEWADLQWAYVNAAPKVQRLPAHLEPLYATCLPLPP